MDTKSSSFHESDFIYVPSINLYVAKDKKFFRKNWFEAHKRLQEDGQKMLTIPEFAEFLKYIKNTENDENLDLFYDIFSSGDDHYYWRGEWLDAKFELKDKKLYIHSNHVIDKKGDLIPKSSEVIDSKTLMNKNSSEDSDIFLEDWFKYQTSQGLPSKEARLRRDNSRWNISYDLTNREDGLVAMFSCGVHGPQLQCEQNPYRPIQSPKENAGVRPAVYKL